MNRDLIRATRGQMPEFLGRSTYPAGEPVGSEHRRRHRFEGERERSQTEFPRSLDRLRQQFAVPAVDAVERPDRHDAAGTIEIVETRTKRHLIAHAATALATFTGRHAPRSLSKRPTPSQFPNAS